MHRLRSFSLTALLFLSASASAPRCWSQSAAPEPALGVYRGVNATAGVDAFAAWLGRPVDLGVDFVGPESWSNIAWPTFWLDAWSKWVHAKPGRRLVLGIPMLAGPVDGSGPTQGDKGVGVPVSLEKGAEGAYNDYFKDLAENLVHQQLGDTILRPGWEFNGGWYAWRGKGKTEAFAKYWRQIVATMRSVSGTENLKFCWNPTLGDQDFPADEAWPGDDVVDYVGIDVYDETWNPDTYPWPKDTSAADIERRQKKAWDEWIYYSPRGLKFWSEFAQKHGKPLAFPEWGLVNQGEGHGGMDNLYFLSQMHEFITAPANHVAFACYFDFNEAKHRDAISPNLTGGKDEGTDFPKSSAQFKALFGGR
jgi:hypothetical protein